jgi:hypothetical protein
MLDTYQVYPRCGRVPSAGMGRKVRVNQSRGELMANAAETHPMDEIPEEPVPLMQQLLDNPFLLLFLGVVVPTVFYLIWGVLEILSLPLAK